MLKKYWIWTSAGLLILGGIEAWLSGFSYIPFAWVLATMNSVVALVVKGVTTFVYTLRKCFSPVKFEPMLVNNYFRNDAGRHHDKSSKSTIDDPLDPNNPDSMSGDYHGDPIFDPTHPMYDLYDDFR